MEYVYAIVGLVVVFNFYMLFSRRKKSRSTIKKAMDERKAAERNYMDTKRRLDIEQEKAAKHVEMQRRTHELYEQARKRAETADTDKYY
jgi:hypothetical protein